MKRTLALLLTLVMIVSLFAGCGAKQEAPAADAPAAAPAAPAAPAEEEAKEVSHDPITLNLSMTATLDEHHGAAYEPMAAYIQEKCPWITVTIHPSSTLYDDGGALDAIMRGNVEMCVTAPGYLGEYAPEAAIFGACYIFNDADHMLTLMKGEVGQEFYDTVAENTGIRILGTLYKGRRTINLREDKEVKSRADLNGVLLRVPNAQSWLDMGNALGATPTPMALSEVYLGLNAGTVDGQDNPLQATMAYGFGEVTKSITMTNHVIDLNWLCISEEIWQSFDAETQQVLKDAFQIAADFSYDAYMGEEAELIAQFRDMGVTVYDNTDMSQMKKEVWEYYWDHPEISGGWDKDVYEKIMAAS